MRPEDAAAREVPVPQPAAAAIERRVDAAAHGVVDVVGLARARRLPVECEAEDQHHEAGGGRERDGERGVGAPRRQRLRAPVHDRDLALRRAEPMHGGEGRRAVRKNDLRHAGRGAQGIQWLRMAEQIGEPSADQGPVGLRHGHCSAVMGRRSRRGPPRRSAPSELVTTNWRPGASAQAAIACSSSDCLRRSSVSGGAPQSLGEEAGAGHHAPHDLADRLAAVVDHLHEGADADGDEKGDDQRRHRATQRGLRRQETPIGGLCDRLRQALDGVGIDRRARRLDARHAWPPFGSSSPNIDRKDVPHLPESLSIGIEKCGLVEKSQRENSSSTAGAYAADFAAYSGRTGPAGHAAAAKTGSAASVCGQRALDDVADVARQ